MIKRILIMGLVLIMLLSSSCQNNTKSELNWKLFQSISNSNLQGLKEIQKADKDINYSDIGFTETTSFAPADSSGIIKDSRALSIAFVDGDEEIVKLLIEAGAPVNNKEDNYTYLNWAIDCCSLDICEKLISEGADVNIGEYSALETLIRNHEPNDSDYDKKLKLLIDNGAKVSNKLMDECLKKEWRYSFASDVLQLIKKHNKKSDIEQGLEAAISGDNDSLQNLVQKNKIKDKEVVIMFAAANCNVETLRLMDSAGYDFSVVDENRINLLHIASLCNGKDVVEYLLNKGINGDAISDNGYQVITYAAIGGNEDVINLLLERGFNYQKGKFETFYEDDFEYVNSWEEACIYGSADSVKALLKLGYELSDDDKHIAYAESNEDTFDEVARQNISFDVPLNEEYPVDKAKETQTIKLVQMGAKVTNATLVNAIEWRNYDLLKILIEKNIKQVNEDVSSPIVAAIRVGDLKCLKLLVENGTDINQDIIGIEDDVNCSPLHIAAESPSVDILEYLIQQGADIKKKDSEGKTPYDYAKEWKFKDNMELLE